eukprot:365601-Chlamydomonas_euryale.AAC.2
MLPCSPPAPSPMLLPLPLPRTPYLPPSALSLLDVAAAMLLALDSKPCRIKPRRIKPRRIKLCRIKLTGRCPQPLSARRLRRDCDRGGVAAVPPDATVNSRVAATAAAAAVVIGAVSVRDLGDDVICAVLHCALPPPHWHADACPRTSSTTASLARPCLSAQFVFVIVAAMPFVLLSSVFYHRLTGTPLPASLIKFYVLFNRVPGNLFSEPSAAAIVLVNAVYYLSTFSFALMFGVVTEEVKRTYQNLQEGVYQAR